MDGLAVSGVTVATRQMKYVPWLNVFEDEQPRSLKERIGSKQVVAVALSALAKAAGSRALYE